MGRTNATYRRFLESFEESCQPYKRALRYRYTDDFEQLFEHAAQFADAAGYVNRTDPEIAVLLSMLLAQ